MKVIAAVVRPAPATIECKNFGDEDATKLLEALLMVEFATLGPAAPHLQRPRRFLPENDKPDDEASPDILEGIL